MKKDVKIYILLGILIATIFVAILWSLISFNVIRIPKPYEPKYITLSEDELGSAHSLRGRTALVTVFSNDSEYSWDFDSEEFLFQRNEIFRSTRIAADWICEQAAKYGINVDFVCAETENDDFLYHEKIFTGKDDMLLAGMLGNILNNCGEPEWGYIENEIDNEELKSKYACDNVLYLFFVNTPLSSDLASQAFAVYNKELKKPYEYCVYAGNKNNEIICASTIAHEIIHTFGAPDLYERDTLRLCFEITDEVVEYCKENFPTDIMLSTKDPETGEWLIDKITNEITPITAYYIGWCDAPIDIDEFELVHSQFDRPE